MSTFCTSRGVKSGSVTHMTDFPFYTGVSVILNWNKLSYFKSSLLQKYLIIIALSSNMKKVRVQCESECIYLTAFHAKHAN